MAAQKNHYLNILCLIIGLSFSQSLLGQKSKEQVQAKDSLTIKVLRTNFKAQPEKKRNFRAF